MLHFIIRKFYGYLSTPIKICLIKCKMVCLAAEDVTKKYATSAMAILLYIKKVGNSMFLFISSVKIP